MTMETGPFDAALAAWEGEAARGKDASYRGWTFFDTNCISELVKLGRCGYGDEVRRFVAGRDVLMPSSLFQELRRAPDLANEIPSYLETANLYLVSSTTDFWKCDLWNFINTENHPRNVLEAYQFSSEVFSLLGSHEEFGNVCAQSEQNVSVEFPSRVGPDIGAMMDERDLHSVIWNTINRHSKEFLNLEIPPADCRPGNFPSFFVYFYVYYFRYIKKAKVSLDPNDFIDLQHVIAAPYCSEFYVERSFASILRNNVKGRLPPSPYLVAKKRHRNGVISDSDLRDAAASHAMRDATTPLLPRTQIYTIGDLRAATTGKPASRGG